MVGADHKPPGQSDRHPACSGDVVRNPSLKGEPDVYAADSLLSRER